MMDALRFLACVHLLVRSFIIAPRSSICFTLVPNKLCFMGARGSALPRVYSAALMDNFIVPITAHRGGGWR